MVEHQTPAQDEAIPVRVLPAAAQPEVLAAVVLVVVANQVEERPAEVVAAGVEVAKNK